MKEMKFSPSNILTFSNTWRLYFLNTDIWKWQCIQNHTDSKQSLTTTMQSLSLLPPSCPSFLPPFLPRSFLSTNPSVHLSNATEVVGLLWRLVRTMSCKGLVDVNVVSAITSQECLMLLLHLGVPSSIIHILYVICIWLENQVFGNVNPRTHYTLSFQSIIKPTLHRTGNISGFL